MRLAAVSCSLALLAMTAASAFDGQAVAATPNPCPAGQAVTLRWYFTGAKVLLAGGRFGKGAVVTGRTSAVDRPTKPTRYTFQVWYYVPDPKATMGSSKRKLLHARYEIVVRIAPPFTAALKDYADSHGWRVSYPKEWKHDAVAFSDPTNNALVFFQKEDDSVERLAVSVLPAGDMSAMDLTKRVEISLPTNYDDVETVSKTETMHANTPAVLSVFRGKDLAHDGLRTESVVLAFVSGGRAYVVSARAPASAFASRQAFLEHLVRTFRPARAAGSQSNG